jgi:hypothetical protein
MTSKRKTSTTDAANLQTLKIGSRVRCTDDGVTGRIVWANAASVKITWDDGEQVTWRRDSLAGRPIEILDDDTASTEHGPAEVPLVATAPEPPSPEQASQPEALATELPSTPAVSEEVSAPEVPMAELVPSIREQMEDTASTSSAPVPTVPAKPKRQRKATTEPEGKKLSAIDAAAWVLQEAATPMTTQEMIGAMAIKGYWSSPAGKTPAATLYSAILREITSKGNASRFTKPGPGRFARNPQV